jgi:hypothetical protein
MCGRTGDSLIQALHIAEQAKALDEVRREGQQDIAQAYRLNYAAERRAATMQVSLGNIRTTLGNIRLTLGNIRTTLGNIRSTYFQTTLENIRTTLGNIQTTLRNI